VSLDAALGKVEERAKALSIARNFPDFGKIIRDAEAGIARRTRLTSAKMQPGAEQTSGPNSSAKSTRSASAPPHCKPKPKR